MDVHPTKNVSIGIDPYPYVYIKKKLTDPLRFNLQLQTEFDDFFAQAESRSYAAPWVVCLEVVNSGGPVGWPSALCPSLSCATLSALDVYIMIYYIY